MTGLARLFLVVLLLPAPALAGALAGASDDAASDPQPEAARRFLDPVTADGAWRAGAVPDAGGRVHLTADAGTHLHLPAGETLHLSAARAPDVWVGHGGGLERRAGLTPAGAPHRWTLPPEPLGDRYVTIEAGAAEGLDVTLEKTRTEIPPDLLDPGTTVETFGGERVRLTAPGSAGKTQAVRLALGETLSATVQGARWLSIRQRAWFQPDEPGQRAAWSLRVTAGGRSSFFDHGAAIDPDGPLIDGRPVAVSQRREALVELPEGATSLELTASRSLVLELRAARPRLPELEPAALRSLLQARGRGPDSDPATLSEAEAAALIAGADTPLPDLRLAVERLALALEPRPSLTDAAMRLLQAGERERRSVAAARLARSALARHGFWQDLDWSAPEAVAVHRTQVRTRLAAQAGPQPPRRLPTTSAAALASPGASASLIESRPGIRFALPQSAAPSRVRMLLAGAAQDGRIVLRSRDGEQTVLRVTPFSLPAAARVDRAAFDALRASSSALSVVAATDPLASAAARDVLALEWSLPAGGEALELVSTTGIAQLALQARSWRPFSPEPSQRRLALEGVDPALALSALTAPPAAARERWQLQGADLAAWLERQRQRFEDRIAPRGPETAGTASVTAPEARALAARDPELVRSLETLDTDPRVPAREAAVLAMVDALDRADEAFLAERTLRAAVAFEAPAVSVTAGERLAARYREADARAELVRLRAVRFLRAPTPASLCMLVDALTDLGDADRASAFAIWSTCGTQAPLRLELAHVDEGARLRAEIDRVGWPAAGEGSQPGLTTDSQRRWLEWWQRTPGRWDWRTDPGAVIRASGARRLVDREAGARLASATLSADAPLEIAAPLPGPVRLQLRPRLGAEAVRLVAIDLRSGSSGQRFALDLPAHQAARNLEASSGPLPATATTFDLPHPGPWRLELARGTADLRVQQRAPRTPSASLPAPTAFAATLAGRPPRGAAAGASFEVPRTEADLPAEERTGAQAPEVMAGQPLAVPTYEPLDLPARFLRAVERADLAPATDLVSARARLRGLELLARAPGADATALHREAVRLVDQFTALRTDLRSMVFPGRWERIVAVDQSAGDVERIEPAALETTPGLRLRHDLLGLPADAQRVLYGDRALVFASSWETPRTLVVDLAALRLGMLAPQPATVRLGVEGRERRVALAAGETRRLELTLPAGGGRLTVELEAPGRDTWVSVALRDADSNEAIAWQSAQRWHAALPNEPLQLTVAGPALLRITRPGDRTGTLRTIEAGTRQFIFSASGREPELFRFHLRRSAEHPQAPPAAAIEALAQGGPGRDDGEVVQAQVARDVESARPSAEAPTPSSRATWTVGTTFDTRLALEDDLEDARSESFGELTLQRRRRSEDGDRWDESEVLLRGRDEGDTVLGLRHRRDLALGRDGLMVHGSATAFLQRTPSGETASAVTLRAGILQRRLLSPRSRHTPELRVFLRELSLDDVPSTDRAEVDQDVFTPYKRTHRYGVLLRDTLRFDPTPEQRLYARASALLNENTSVDLLALDLGLERLVGPAEIGLEYRARAFADDEDRRRSTTAHRIAFDVDWRRFDHGWSHWQFFFSGVYDISAGEPALSLSVQRHLGRGRGVADFRPGFLPFAVLRRMTLPYEETRS